MMYLFSIILSLFISSVILAEDTFDIGTISSTDLDGLSTNFTCALGNIDSLLARSEHHQHTDVCLHNPQGSTARLESIVKLEPWTNEPQCMRRFNGSGSLCVFTNSAFAQGRGIAILTKSSIAKKISELPAFTDPKAMVGTNIGPGPPPFVVQALPGRGMGVIANRTIERGDLVMAYTPTTIFHAEAFDRGTANDDPDYRILHMTVDQLPKSSRALWMDLAAHFKGGDIYNEKINTNSFSEELNEEEHYIVIPEISRMNHDCRPNAMYYFDLPTLTQNVHATRNIYAGEEITITYLDPLQTLKTRRAATKRSWGFECSCSLCTQSPALTRESDRRIRAIIEMTDHLRDWNQTSKGSPEMAELLISMYEQERLYASIADAYTLAALAYNAVGNEWIAVKYAMRAVEVGIIYSGPRDVDVADMKDLLRGPREHPSWMLRKRVLGES